MNRPRLRFGVLRAFAVAALVGLVVPLAFGATKALNATGVIAGSGTSYTLTVTNTGDQPIRCMRLFPAAGVQATAGAPPPDWQSGTSAGFIGFFNPNGLAPGASVAFSFTTAAAYPPSAGGDLHISTDCQTDVVVKATGPVATPPPPTEKPCKCADLTVTVDGPLLTKKVLRPTKHDFGISFSWDMTCSEGKGGCKGVVQFQPPQILAGTLPKPSNALHLNVKTKTFICKADCGAGDTGSFEVKMLSRDQLKKLFGRKLAFSIKTICAGTVRTTKLSVFVSQRGKLTLTR